MWHFSQMSGVPESLPRLLGQVGEMGERSGPRWDSFRCSWPPLLPPVCLQPPTSASAALGSGLEVQTPDLPGWHLLLEKTPGLPGLWAGTGSLSVVCSQLSWMKRTEKGPQGLPGRLSRTKQSGFTGPVPEGESCCAQSSHH